MPIRKLATVEEIRAFMEHLIRTDEEHDGDCSGRGIPTPVQLVLPDTVGWNWTVNAYPQVTPGCRDFIKSVVAVAMREFTLRV